MSNPQSPIQETTDRITVSSSGTIGHRASNSGSQSSGPDTPGSKTPSSIHTTTTGLPARRSERLQAQECRALVDRLHLELQSLYPTLLPPVAHHAPQAVCTVKCQRPGYMIALFMQARVRGAASPDLSNGELWESIRAVAAEGVSETLEDLPCRRFALRFVRLRESRRAIDDAVGDVEYWTS
ncbi:hypothetical protein F4814DRAFT_235593 [Daldinia grandis]|nr:hypothetical protein F4814DRAFT_235593 [Daldinia grandis]